MANALFFDRLRAGNELLDAGLAQLDPAQREAAQLELLRSPNAVLRRLVAGAEDATATVLAKALEDEEWEVRHAAAGNPNIDAAGLAKALEDENRRVRGAAAGNKSATIESLSRALTSGNEDIVSIALCNESLVADAIPREVWFDLIVTLDFDAREVDSVVNRLPDHLFRDPELNLAMLLMAGCAPAR